MAKLQRVSSLSFADALDHQTKTEIVMDKLPSSNGYVNQGFNGISINGVNLPNLVNDKPIPNCDNNGGEDNVQKNHPNSMTLNGLELDGNANGFSTIDLSPTQAQAPCSNDEAAIVVINASKSYTHGKKAKPILHNFCMTVKAGTIYGLLGSSGCGKTTLLSAVVGMKHLDSGRILIFGAKVGTPAAGVPGKRVGYMPQETALYGKFSISETITYFGSLYGMSRNEIEKSREVLMNLLSLPEGERRVSTLSGGQRRRLSLAVALVHSPEIVILDEPTVGIDPLLRMEIWKHLISLVESKKTTVIVTTHYIAEAGNCNTIGIMRGGRLLTEKSPKLLFEEHKTNDLEEVVLKLCHEDEKDSLGYGRSRSKSGNIIKVTVDRRYSHPAKRKMSCSAPTSISSIGFAEYLERVKDSLTRIKSLTMKNVFVMLRNIFLVLFVILLPAMQTVVMGMSMGNDPRPIKVGVVNHDYNYTGGCSLQPVNLTGECETGNLSCRYLRSLPLDTIQLINYKDEESARSDIKMGTIRSFMAFPEGYSDAMYERSTTGVLVENETLQSSMLLFEMDASNAVVTKSLQGIVFAAYKTFVQGMLSDCGFNPELGGLPIKFQNPIYGDYNLELREYVAAGMLVGVALFFPLCSSSITYIWDKKQGTMERARVAGTQTWEIMLSYVVTEGIILLFQTFLSFLILIFIFKITVIGSMYLAVFLVILNGLAGISLGLLIASVCTEEIQAILLGLAIIFPNFFLAGSIWPIEGMPMILQYCSYFLPGTLANEAFRSIVVRGWGFTHFYVWTGFASTLAWACFYWACGIYVHKVTLAKL